MTPSAEKAAPIPADVLALADKVVIEFCNLHEYAGRPTWVEPIARAIMQDRADRVSQEERIREAADRIAILEAAVSDAERRGLERAAAEADKVYQDWIAMRDGGRMSKLTAQTYADMAFYIAGRVRAIIPEDVDARRQSVTANDLRHLLDECRAPQVSPDNTLRQLGDRLERMIEALEGNP